MFEFVYILFYQLVSYVLWLLRFSLFVVKLFKVSLTTFYQEYVNSQKTEIGCFKVNYLLRHEIS